MNKLIAWGNAHKTALTGMVLIVTGVVAMLISNGDGTQISNGWTQILAGLTAIFLQGKIQKVQDTAENVVPTKKIDALNNGESVTVKNGSETIEVIKVEPKDETVM